MKTRLTFFLTAICILVIAYALIIAFTMGPEDILNPVGILYFPSIVIQLAANEGNGIICVDACGPCSAWGTYYVLIDGECINGPDGKVCSNNAFGHQWRFFDGRCSSFVPERVPYEFSNEFINSDVVLCNNASEDNIVCNSVLKESCLPLDQNVWKWSNMYELCFKMQNQTGYVDYCSNVKPQDMLCNPENNNYICPSSTETYGWSYNDIDHICYKWVKNEN